MNQKRKVQVVILAIKPGSKKVTRVLLLKTNQKRGGFWQNVTGSVEKYERFHKAAIREVWEETGLSTDDIHIFKDLKLEHCFKSRKGHHVKEKSFVIVTTKMKIKIDPKEHQHYKWQAIKLIRSSNYKFPTNFESFCLAKKSFKN